MNLHHQATSTKRERTRQAIINAAIVIIAKKGLASASIDELMAQTGMTRGTFYNYFQTREELLTDVTEQVRDHMQQHIEQLLPAKLSSEQIVAYTVYAVVKYAVERPSLGRLLIKLSNDTDFFSPLDVDDQHFRRSNNALMQLVKTNTDFLATQIYMVGAINSLIIHLLQKRILIPQAEQTMALILQGIGVAKENVDALIQEARDFADYVHKQNIGNCEDFNLPN